MAVISLASKLVLEEISNETRSPMWGTLRGSRCTVARTGGAGVGFVADFVLLAFHISSINPRSGHPKARYGGVL